MLGTSYLHAHARRTQAHTHTGMPARPPARLHAHARVHTHTNMCVHTCRTFSWISKITDSPSNPFQRYWIEHILPQFSKHSISFYELHEFHESDEYTIMQNPRFLWFESVTFFTQSRPCDFGHIYGGPTTIAKASSQCCTDIWKRARDQVLNVLSLPQGRSKNWCATLLQQRLKVKIIQLPEEEGHFEGLPSELADPVLHDPEFIY